jgi:SAM-dependent methyltransferase
MAQTVEGHYGSEGIARRILDALASAGVTEVSPQTLGPADQLHAGGIDATRNLASVAGMKAGDRVLDMGSGLGGPARVFASEFGCDVTGIDLTPEFVRDATLLTERCGLAEKVRFDVGSALAMPYADASFDVVVTEHAVMNIEDRAGFYREAFRVLKPGGAFAFFDTLRGTGAEPTYPLPWAQSPEISFLLTASETRAAIAAAGIVEEEWRDLPPWRPPQFDGPLSPATVLGPGLIAGVKNVTEGLGDGRLLLTVARFRKP